MRHADHVEPDRGMVRRCCGRSGRGGIHVGYAFHALAWDVTCDVLAGNAPRDLVELANYILGGQSCSPWYPTPSHNKSVPHAG